MNTILTAERARQIATDPVRNILNIIFEVSAMGGTKYDFSPQTAPLTDVQLDRLRDLGYTVDVSTEMMYEEDHYGKDVPGTEHKAYLYTIYW